MKRFGKRFGIGLSALLLIVVVVVGGTYVRLLIAPVSLNFLRDQISQTLQKTLPDGFDAELGNIELALGEGGAANVRVSPLVLREAKTNAEVVVREAHVRIKPVSFLQGKSSAGIDLFGAEIGLVYDEASGFRLATLVLHKDETFGDKYMGIERTTYLIDESGNVAHVWPKVSVPGHVDEVLVQAQA